MPRGNMYLSELEVRLCLSAIDSMLEHLPPVELVPLVDQSDTRRDRAAYELLHAKLAQHLT